MKGEDDQIFDVDKKINGNPYGCRCQKTKFTRRMFLLCLMRAS